LSASRYPAYDRCVVWCGATITDVIFRFERIFAAAFRLSDHWKSRYDPRQAFGQSYRETPDDNAA